MSQVSFNYNLVIPEQHRQKLLEELDEFIGSKRLKSKIVSWKQLLDVLYKRNVFQTEESETVRTIFAKYPDNVFDYYRKYLTSIDSSSKSFNSSYYSAFERHKEEIYELITNNVSAEYLNFGRGLRLLSDKLERIEKNSRMNAEKCETITYKILIEAEKEHKHNTPDMIIKALKAIKRNDTARKVEKILKDK